MAKYRVKKIRKGLDKGKWGVYRGRYLCMSFVHKGSATRDADRRKDNDETQGKK